jgi:hypothetical protein
MGTSIYVRMSAHRVDDCHLLLGINYVYCSLLYSGIDFGTAFVSAGLYMYDDDGKLRYTPVKDDEGRHRIPCRVSFDGKGQCHVGGGGAGEETKDGGGNLRVESTVGARGGTVVERFRPWMGHSTTQDMKHTLPNCPAWANAQPGVVSGPRDRPMYAHVCVMNSRATCCCAVSTPPHPPRDRPM